MSTTYPFRDGEAEPGTAESPRRRHVGLAAEERAVSFFCKDPKALTEPQGRTGTAGRGLGLSPSGYRFRCRRPATGPERQYRPPRPA